MNISLKGSGKSHEQKLAEIIAEYGIMTPEEFYEKMLEIRTDANMDAFDEYAHGPMDDLMCKLLISLGYEKGIEVFRKTPKWYE